MIRIKAHWYPEQDINGPVTFVPELNAKYVQVLDGRTGFLPVVEGMRAQDMNTHIPIAPKREKVPSAPPAPPERHQ